MAVLRPTVAYGNTDDGSGAGVNGSSDDRLCCGQGSGRWCPSTEMRMVAQSGL